ncbi:hypothetical protein CFB46_12060 [Burkholderia sp. HI2761]|uniref:hypothetical protein n=1 Tax=unclassified Burkholderia TaxID=2613784 RepID=UPI000B7A5441|nr:MULTISPECIES: hypothetical protein [unclassified Burkholderia]MPV55878.1 hypothetical protein [Burkholderia sp. BE24]OXJ27446.1 hypothetical protein CFB46_12060 [Burkholderia sp. HI2761]
MKRAWEITQLAFVWLLIAIGFLAVFRIWTIVAQAAGSTKDFWDVAAAIGTCGAVIVALYIAYADKRRKREDELSAARVSATGIYARLGVAIGAVRTIQIRVSEALVIDRGPGIIPIIEANFDGIPTIETEELRALIPLGDQCAENISAAIDRIQVSKRLIGIEGAKPRPTKQGQQDCLNFVNAILLEAITMLDRASKTVHACSQTFRESF